MIFYFHFNFLYFIAQYLFHAIVTNNQTALISASINNASPSTCNLVAKSESNYLISHILHSLKFLLNSEF
jgi:hypothetical protein